MQPSILSLRSFPPRRAFLLSLVLSTGACVVGEVTQHPAPDAPDAGQVEPRAIVYESISGGRFQPLAGYHDLRGRAQMVRGKDGKTDLDLAISGLPPHATFATHVHALPCAFQGGGHYKLDPSVVDATESNEIWGTVTSDADGNGTATLHSDTRLRGDAMAIVLHDPTSSAKMACADLRPDDEGEVVATGTFAPFAAAEAADQTIAGSATLARRAGSTAVALDVQGLDAAAQYLAHVHALPCAVTEGGGHYKLDPTVVDPVAENEIWPAIMTGSVASTSSMEASHVAREDAQAIVIHRMTAAGAIKVACADLVRPYPALRTGGDALVTADGMTRGYGDLRAHAELVRDLDGSTTVTFHATGLTPGKTYPAHVHRLPCAAGAGGHYPIDATQPDGTAGNDIALAIAADGTGAADATVQVAALARSDAQALVVHDPDDKAKLACIDLD